MFHPQANGAARAALLEHVEEAVFGVYRPALGELYAGLCADADARYAAKLRELRGLLPQHMGVRPPLWLRPTWQGAPSDVWALAVADADETRSSGRQALFASSAAEPPTDTVADPHRQEVTDIGHFLGAPRRSRKGPREREQ